MRFFPLDQLLNLPEMTVKKWGQRSEGFFLHLARVNSGINCPHCQQKTQELHQVRYLLVRDLPAFDQPVYLKVPRRQFYCRHCQKYITEELDYIDTKRKETRRYQENIYQKVLKSSIEQVSQEENLTYEEVESLFILLSQSAHYQEWATRKRLSIDEISKKKGHKNFITLVSDVDTGNLLEVIDSHKEQEIIELDNTRSDVEKSLKNHYGARTTHYIKELNGLLQSKDWKEADLLTWNAIFYSALTKDIDTRNFSYNNVSCDALREIDGQWYDSSGGRFGFKVQKRIYIETGNPIGDYDSEAYWRFVERVGWSESGEWKRYQDLVWDKEAPQIAPEGHLPAGVRRSGAFGRTLFTFTHDYRARDAREIDISFLSLRLVNCSI